MYGPGVNLIQEREGRGEGGDQEERNKQKEMEVAPDYLAVLLGRRN